MDTTKDNNTTSESNGINIEEEQKFLKFALKRIEEEKKFYEYLRDRERLEADRIVEQYNNCKGEVDSYEEAGYFSLADVEANSAELIKRRLAELEEAEKKPYYGIMRVKYDDGEIVTYRIGRTNINGKYLIPIVSGWIADIAELYYNTPIGKASYKTENGIVHCELLDKYFVDIKDGQVKKIIYNGVGVMQSKLRRPSAGIMGDITETIQPEQFSIFNI